MNGTPTSRHHPDGVAKRSVIAMAILLLVLASSLAMAAEGGGPDTETVRGHVYDERGMPAEGVLVRIEGRSLGVPTGANGAFSLSGDDLEGPLVIVVTVEGYMKVRLENLLENGATWELDIYLVEEVIEPGAIEGTVTSFQGEPVEGALVILDAGVEGDRAALTDRKGRFRLEDLSPDVPAYTISIEAPQHATYSADVTVVPGETIWLNVTLAPESPMELLWCKVVDPRGLPLPGATITIEGSLAEWTTDLDGWFSALLDGRMGTRVVTAHLSGYAEKSLEVEFPEPGVANIEMTLPLADVDGPETLWVRVLTSSNGEPVQDATVTLGGRGGTWRTDALGTCVITGHDLEGVRTVTATKERYTSAYTSFPMQQGGTGVVTLAITRSSNAVTLEGVVMDAASGEPLAFAQVVVDSGGIVWLTMTDELGAFLVHNLPPDIDTSVTVHAEGYATGMESIVLVEYSANVVTLRLEPDVVNLVDVAGAVSEEGDPLANAKVTVWTDELELIAWTDEEGLFEFTGLPVRSARLAYKVEHMDHATQYGYLDLPRDGGRTSLTVDMGHVESTMTLVKGRVVDPDGLPVDGATVQLSTGWEVTETRTVAGLYELYVDLRSDLTADVTVTGTGYGRSSLSAILREGVVNRVNLTVPLGPDHGNVVGQVQVDGRRPLEGAEVQLSMGGALHLVRTTGPDGGFAFQLVPAVDTQYQLSVIAEGFDGVTIEVTVPGGGTTRHNLTVREDVTSVETISGTVLNADGLPMANAVVRVGGTRTILTSANGTYVLAGEDLEGRWVVTASLQGFESTHRIVEVLPGTTVRVDLTMAVMDARATSVGGTVLRASNAKPIEGATVRLGRSAATDWTFETTTGPDGSFSFSAVPLAWGGVTVTVTREGFHDDVAHAALSGSQATWLDFYMQRVVVPEPEEPVLTDTQAKRIGAGASITIGALAIILMTEVGRAALLGLVLVPLYTKIKREKVMDHFVRGRIYEFVCQNPGVNYSAIKEQFKLTNGTVTYHLSMLERQEFIRAKQDGIYKRYFANNGGTPASDVEPMSLQLTIAKAIRERPGMTQKEIAKRVGSSKQLVSYHIRRMRKEGQLETRRHGRSVRVFPNHLTPE